MNIPCESCGHQIEDPRLGRVCAACYHEQHMPGCDHCGDTEVELDLDDLCGICAYEYDKRRYGNLR